MYADNVNILGGSLDTIKKKTGSLIISGNEIGLEVHAEKTKYMVMYRDQHAAQNHDTDTGNESFDSVEQFR